MRDPLLPSIHGGVGGVEGGGGACVSGAVFVFLSVWGLGFVYLVFFSCFSASMGGVLHGPLEGGLVEVLIVGDYRLGSRPLRRGQM